MKRAVIPAFLTMAIFVLAEAATEARKWTDTTGQFSVEAGVIEIRDDNVLLLREDGKIAHVSIARLSKADREYLVSLRQLQGTWQVVSAMSNGGPVSRELWEKKHVITGNNVVVTQHSGETIILEIEIYAAKTPKQIDAIAHVEDKDIVIHGIYTVDANELRLCFAQPGKARPSELSTRQGDMQSLAVLRRVPDNAKKPKPSAEAGGLDPR
jgi:uncharacterized protein (TIGR03067 family)